MTGAKLKKPAAPALVQSDPLLKPFQEIILRRQEKITALLEDITRQSGSLADFASGHEYFGLHFQNGQWVFREWAPNADQVYLIGPFSGWEPRKAFQLERINQNGVWEIQLPAQALNHGDAHRLLIKWAWGQGDRIPAYARRVVQDWQTGIFSAQVWKPETPHQWKHPHFVPKPGPVFVYEAHAGMAQEEPKIGTFAEFREKVLPRIVRAGYTTLQLMAVVEHPYYGSFGYQVSSFFAPSSRFGTPEELKELIDEAHANGVAVIMDIIHSHAVANEVEGLAKFDGTPYQYFHEGDRGVHWAWGSRCFDYAKPQVLHFLLSNCRYWLDEFHVDGFRFDGVTSMLYLDHGLEKAFTSYQDYFGDNVDEDALAYLALANRLIHGLRPHALTIAEDVSGMPGLAADQASGGYGFDYRFAMGVPDYWIKLLKDSRDEDWSMGHLWHELTNKRRDEKTISYAESHDQALVGDQTLIFRMMGSDMYWHMSAQDGDLNVDRGMALHKMIRLATLATAGNGYLNFMGNEFGHPDWIDFPRDGNGWSFQHARRQWSLVDSPDLKFQHLARFDRDMISLARERALLEDPEPAFAWEDDPKKILAFSRAGLVFVFNFHPTESLSAYPIPAPPGKYRMILDTDAGSFGGHARLAPGQEHFTQPDKTGDRHLLTLYLPCRTAQVLARED